jgi:hypothetical protein
MQLAADQLGAKMAYTNSKMGRTTAGTKAAIAALVAVRSYFNS